VRACASVARCADCGLWNGCIPGPRAALGVVAGGGMEFDEAVVILGMAVIGLLVTALLVSLARTRWCPGGLAAGSPKIKLLN